MSEKPPMPPDRPFQADTVDDRRAVLVFNEIVDQYRTPSLVSELRGYVQQYEAVAFDVSASEDIQSPWLRLFAELSEEAKEAGKSLSLVGMKSVLLRRADLLGVKESLRLCTSLEEAWKS